MNSKILAVAFVFLLAMVTQYYLTVHGDVLYLVSIAQAITEGKQYGIDFFETNPPMILYLSLPALWLMKTGLSMPASVDVYVFALFFAIFWLVASQLKILIPDKLVYHTFLGMILFVMLFLPGNQFAQREHLFLVLVLPYLFTTVARLEKKAVPPWRALLVGILAGFGFGLKPYFLCPLVMLESWMIYHRKNLWGWLRVESVVVLLMLLIYLLSVFVFFHTYFTIMLPLIKLFYLPAIKQPWINILTDTWVLFSLVIFFGTRFFMQKNDDNFLLKRVLQVTLAGMIAGLFITKTYWSYHVIPSIGMACLVASLYFSELVSGYFKRFNLFALCVGLVIFSIPLETTVYRFFYCLNLEKNGDLVKVKHYLALQPGKHSSTCFAVSGGTRDCFAVALRTQGTYGSRYPFFWWMWGLNEQINNKNLSIAKYAQYKNYFCESVAKDLEDFKPRWVIINPKFTRLILHQDDDFSIINFFSDNPRFAAAWTHYGLKKQIESYEIYERKIER